MGTAHPLPPVPAGVPVRALSIDRGNGFADDLRRFNDSNLQGEVERALAQLPAGARGALVGHSSFEKAGLALAARLPAGWSIGGFVDYHYSSKDLKGGAWVQFKW